MPEAGKVSDADRGQRLKLYAIGLEMSFIDWENLMIVRSTSHPLITALFIQTAHQLSTPASTKIALGQQGNRSLI